MSILGESDLAIALRVTEDLRRRANAQCAEADELREFMAVYRWTAMWADSDHSAGIQGFRELDEVQDFIATVGLTMRNVAHQWDFENFIGASNGTLDGTLEFDPRDHRTTIRVRCR